MSTMELKIIEKPIEPVPVVVEKKHELIMELITPDVAAYLFPLAKPLIDDLAAKSLGEFTTDYTYAKIIWGSTQLFYGYIVEDKEEYLKVDEKVSPLENKYRRLFNSKVKKDFAGFVLIEFNPNDPKPPHIWQLAILPKYQNTNILELGQTAILGEFKNIGCKEITMSASRLGWQELAPKMGFVETFTIYRKKLD